MPPSVRPTGVERTFAKDEIIVTKTDPQGRITYANDVFLRMSCSTKAATLGIVATVLAAGLHFGDLGVAVRAGAGALFLLVTVPVAAQMIGRAAYLLGVPLLPGTVDQLRDRYDRQRGVLR